MGSFSPIHWIVVLLIVLILFGGRGKISALMGDFGKGLKAFKKSMKDESGNEAESEIPKAIHSESSAATAADKDPAARN